jgi:hypothetical protein
MIARYPIGGNDTGGGHVVAVPATGSDPDGAVCNPRTQQIFTSNRKGTPAGGGPAQSGPETFVHGWPFTGSARRR